MDTFINLLNNSGFPIAMCGVLSYYIYKLTTAHKEETEKFTVALQNNTLVLQKLCDTLGVEREDSENE